MNKFDAFRNYIGLKQCIRCGRSLDGVEHHFYCVRCWKRDKLSGLADDIDDAFRQLQKSIPPS